jgi:3D (Asp-Asp-Asp) domain-containing protein
MKIQEAEKIIRGRRVRLLSADAMIALGILVCMAVLVLFVVGTLTSFIPNANQLRDDYASMQSELDEMQQDLTRISEEVDAWPGITELAEETIPSLAGPAVEETAGEWVNFYVTAYCPCVECCGKWSGYPLPNGLYPEEGRTVAADINVLPRGTVIEIDGYGIRTVEDTGGAIRGRDLDLFFANHADALAFGAKNLRVRVLP